MAAKRKKLVRRQPLTTRLINSPLDYLLSVSESFELVDWDAQAYSIGLPLGAGCCTLLMLCRIYSSLSPTDSSSIEDTLFVTKSAYDKVPKRRPFFTVIFSSLSLILITICVINSLSCLAKKKKYTLMGRSITNQPDTPSAKKIRYKDPEESSSIPGSPLRKFVDNWSGSSSGSESGTSSSGEDLWELNIWDPPKFNLYVASSYSPLHVLYILYGPLGLFQIVMIIGITGYLFGLCYLFETLVKDREILHSEVLGEYGKKVVKPITAVAKRDVAVGTDGDPPEFYSPVSHGPFSPRDVRESKSRVSMTPTPSSPWRSPIRPNTAQASSATATPLGGKALRQRASMNSLSTANRLHPAGYTATSTRKSWHPDAPITPRNKR